MQSLSLVLDVLDRAEEVARTNKPLDAAEEARRLQRAHPEAGAKVSEIEALIRTELRVVCQGAGDIW